MISSNWYLLVIVFNQCVFTFFSHFKFTTKIYRVDLQTPYNLFIFAVLWRFLGVRLC